MFARILALLALVALAGPASAEVRVVASLPTIGSVAKEVVGDKGSVTVLAPPNQDPHFVDGKPTMMLALNRADLLVRVGLDLERGWLPPLVTGARNGKIQPGQPGDFEATRFAGAPLEANASTDRSLGDVHPGGNPHFWYDPHRVQQMATALGERLAQIDPPNAAAYRANAQRFNGAIGAKLAAWEAQMAPFKGRALVPWHKSLPYLEAWLGLQEFGTVEPLPGISPSPSHLAQLILRMREVKPPAVVISEPWYNLNTARTVAEKAGTKLVVLPGEAGAAPGTDTYAGWMQVVLDRLRAGLEGK